MKVIYIGQSFYPGNVPFYVHTQVLADLGCEVHAIARQRADEISQETIGKVTVHRLPYQIPKGSLAAIQQTFAHARYLAKYMNDIDIVHVTSTVGASLYPIVSRCESAKWILDVRSPPLHQGKRFMLGNKRIKLESSAFHLAMVHSKAVGEDIFGKQKGQFVELPIGVDFQHFTPGRNENLRKSLGIPKDDILLVYSGSISNLRNLSVLIDGFHRSLLQLENVHLMFLGDGEAVVSLKEQCTGLGILHKTHFVGYVPYTDVPKYLQACDIGIGYVPVTPWYNNAPVLKTLECMAMELPTIATNSAGNREYIRNGDNGILVEDNCDALSSAIVNLVQNNSLQEKFRSIARSSIQKFDFRQIVKNVLLEKYCELLKSD